MTFNAIHAQRFQAASQADTVMLACKPVSFLPMLVGLVCLLGNLWVWLLSIPPTHHPVKAIIKHSAVLPSLTAVLKLASVLAWVGLKAALLPPRTLCPLILLQKVMKTASDMKAGPAQLLCSGPFYNLPAKCFSLLIAIVYNMLTTCSARVALYWRLCLNPFRI